MNVFEVSPHAHKSAFRIAEVMVQPGEIPWGQPGWFSEETPDEDGPYVIHYTWEAGGMEFIGVDYFIEGKWCRRWTEYPHFEWCTL